MTEKKEVPKEEEKGVPVKKETPNEVNEEKGPSYTYDPRYKRDDTKPGENIPLDKKVEE